MTEYIHASHAIKPFYFWLASLLTWLLQIQFSSTNPQMFAYSAGLKKIDFG